MPMGRRILGVALALSMMLTVGSVSAGGDGDVYLTVENEFLEAVAEYAGVGALGWFAYDLQEGVHSAITDTSGHSIDHYYVWVCFGSQCVPIDPFEVSR